MKLKKDRNINTEQEFDIALKEILNSHPHNAEIASKLLKLMKIIGDNKDKQHNAVDDDKYLIDSQVNEQNELIEILSPKTTPNSSNDDNTGDEQWSLIEYHDKTQRGDTNL